MKKHIFLLLIGLGSNCADYSDLTKVEAKELEDDEVLIKGSQQDLVNLLLALEMDKSPQAEGIKSVLQDCVDIMERGKENVNPEELKDQISKKTAELTNLCEAIENRRAAKRQKNIGSNIKFYAGVGAAGSASALFAKHFLDTLKMDAQYPKFRYQFKGIDADISATTIVNFVVITGVIGFISFLWKQIHNFFESKEDELVEKALEANKQTKAEIDKLKTQVITLEGINKEVANKLSEALSVLGQDIIPVIHSLQRAEERKLHLAKQNLHTVEQHIQEAQIRVEEHGDSEVKVKQKRVFGLKRLFRKVFGQQSRVVPLGTQEGHQYRDLPGIDSNVDEFGAGAIPGVMESAALPEDDADLEVPAGSAMAQVD